VIIILLLRSHRRSLIVRQTLLDQRIYTVQSLFSSLFDYKLKPIILLQLLSNARRVIRCYCLVRKYSRVRKQSDSNLANRYWIVTRSLRCVQTLQHGLPKTHDARDTCTHTFILKRKKVIKTIGTNEM